MNTNTPNGSVMQEAESRAGAGLGSQHFQTAKNRVSCRANGVDKRPAHPGTYSLFWISLTKTLIPDAITDQHDNSYSSESPAEMLGAADRGVKVILYLPVQGERQLLHHNAINKFLLHTYSHLPLGAGQHTHLHKSSYL